MTSSSLCGWRQWINEIVRADGVTVYVRIVWQQSNGQHVRTCWRLRPFVLAITSARVGRYGLTCWTLWPDVWGVMA